MVVRRWKLGVGGFIGEASVVEPSEDLEAFKRKRRRLLELTDVYVHPLRRGLGWAAALVRSAVQWVNSRGIDLVLRAQPYGPTADRNKRKFSKMQEAHLIEFYAGFGFRLCVRNVMVSRCA